jgi:hypothetical protein
MRARIVVSCAVLLLAACAPGGGESLDGNKEAAGDGEWEALGQGSSYQPGCDAVADLLIRTDTEWADYWGRVHPGAVPPLPAVDFTSESVLATCGPRPDPGHSAEITAVQPEDAGVVRATVTDHEPGPNCANATVVVYTHHAVKVSGVFSAADFTHEAAAGPSC